MPIVKLRKKFYSRFFYIELFSYSISIRFDGECTIGMWWHEHVSTSVPMCWRNRWLSRKKPNKCTIRIAGRNNRTVSVPLNVSIMLFSWKFKHDFFFRIKTKTKTWNLQVLNEKREHFKWKISKFCKFKWKERLFFLFMIKFYHHKFALKIENFTICFVFGIYI